MHHYYFVSMPMPFYQASWSDHNVNMTVKRFQCITLDFKTSIKLLVVVIEFIHHTIKGLANEDVL